MSTDSTPDLTTPAAPTRCAQRPRRRQLQRSLLIVAALALAACSATTRYEVLSFFFDGVPDPNAPPPVAEAAPAARQTYEPAMPDPSTLPKMHQPYAERRCDACHKSQIDRKQRQPGSFNVQDAAALRLPLEQLCVSCHQPTQQRYQHAPAVVGDCSRCHLPHSSPNQHLLKTPTSNPLCLECHDASTMLSQDRHAAFGDRDCAECHDPHAADARFFLRSGWDVGGPTAAPPASEPARPGQGGGN